MNGVEIEVVWFDEHVVRLRVSAGNGRFGAQAEMYISRDGVELHEFADAISGFPTSKDDSRETDLGGAVGSASFVFRSTSGLGHGVLELEIWTDEPFESGERAEFVVPVEAASIDAFVRGLNAMEPTMGSKAHLQGIHPPITGI